MTLTNSKYLCVEMGRCGKQGKYFLSYASILLNYASEFQITTKCFHLYW